MPNIPGVMRGAKSKRMTPDKKNRRQYQTNSTIWHRIRKKQLNKEPLCAHCAKADKITPATDLDHRDGNAHNNNPDNFQSLCKSCHSRKTYRENGGFGRPIREIE